MKKFFYTGIIVLFILGVIYYLIMITLIYVSQDKYVPTSEDKVDYIIVLGAMVKKDGTPSLPLKARLDEVLKYEDGNIPIIVSGGQGANEPVSESSSMKEYLIDQGVRGDIIYEENQATSTYENLLYSKKIIDETSIKTDYNVLIVTNKFHVFRTHMLAKRLGMNTYIVGDEIGLNLKTRIKNLIREPLAIMKSFVFDR